MEFTNEDLEILFEALEAWENEPVRSGMLGAMMQGILIKDKAEAEAAVQDNIAEQERDKKARQRKAILLKAKIVTAIEANATGALFGGPDG